MNGGAGGLGLYLVGEHSGSGSRGGISMGTGEDSVSLLRVRLVSAGTVGVTGLGEMTSGLWGRDPEVEDESGEGEEDDSDSEEDALWSSVVWWMS